MPRITVETSHALGQEEAVRRLKDKFTMAKGAYGDQVSDLQEQWSDSALSFGFKVVGMKIAGTLEAGASHVRLAAEVPLAAMMFKGSIERQVRQELDALLA
ncbi:MAG: polyhydroxyalkanoic acid system family protein [Pirellulales bacterium]|nr:polyhydroxyalkanoic acid system family protein [Pirellulales bacterium]